MLKLSANELRFLAEKADGIRNGTAYLIEEEPGKPDVVPKHLLGDRKPIIELYTPVRGPGVDHPVKIRLLSQGEITGAGALDEADAVFTTQSAVEKFLLPYYMRFWSAAKVGALENELFNDAGVIAAFHIPPSITEGFPPEEQAKALRSDHSILTFGR